MATIGGPVLAGFIISADLFGLSWRPIFLVNLVLGVIGLAVAVRILPHDDGDRSTVVDGWGSGLLGGAMFGLLYGLIEGSHQRLDHDPDRLDRPRPGVLRRLRPPPVDRRRPAAQVVAAAKPKASPLACSSGSPSSPPRSAWSTCRASSGDHTHPLGHGG